MDHDFIHEAKRGTYHSNVRFDILHLCEPEPGRILDVGGGVGATSAYIKEKMNGTFAAVIDGAEIAPHPAVDVFSSGNIEDPAVWESVGGDYDTILCLDVLEHLVDPWKVVRRCSDLLRPGGSLIISIPNVRYHKLTFPLFFRGRFRLKDFGVLDRTHLRWFTKESAQELAICGGLELETCEGGWYMNRASRVERLARFGILPGFLHLNYFLKARRV